MIGCFLFFLIRPIDLNGQAVDNVLKDLKERSSEGEWFKMNGGISSAFNFNHISGIPRRFDPFSWRLNANLNFDIMGVSAPFSAVFSNGSSVYNLPKYSFYGLSPSYKYITLHLGDRSMNFSPYTLSGHNFYGAGLELKPGNFRFSFMYGQLKRARAEDANSIQNFEPSYERKGWGFKTGYDNGKSKLSVILFNAADDPLSIPIPLTSTTIQPQANVVLGLEGKHQFGKVVSLAVDVARSALTRNQHSFDISPDHYNTFQKLGGLFEPNASSGFYHAIKTSLGFNTDLGQFNLNHERIDPGYKTLGSLYFNNDLENITASTTTSLFKKKLTLSANAGLQRNNLSGDRSNSSNRFIGAVNAGYTPTDRLNFNLAISNFSTTNRMRAVTVPVVQIDSIILVQTNQSGNLSVSYLAGKEKKSVLTGMFSYQQSNSIENDIINKDQTTTYYMGILAFNRSIPELKLNLSASLMANYGLIPNINLLTVAPSFNISKSMLEDKLNLTTSTSFSSVWTNGNNSNRIFTIQANAGYRLLKKHQVSLQMNWVDNKQNGGQSGVGEAFSEFTGGVTYGLNF